MFLFVVVLHVWICFVRCLLAAELLLLLLALLFFCCFCLFFIIIIAIIIVIIITIIAITHPSIHPSIHPLSLSVHLLHISDGSFSHGLVLNISLGSLVSPRPKQANPRIGAEASKGHGGWSHLLIFGGNFLELKLIENKQLGYTTLGNRE